jgi:hypothetical protein
MEIPETIKIGAHVFTVEMVQNLRNENGGGVCGMCNGAECRIRINPGYPQSTNEATLIHEVIEAINYLYELGLEHQQITSLEEVLYQVLKENKLHFDE